MNTFMCNMYKKNVWISCYFHVIKSAAFQTLMKSEKNLFLNMHFGFCSNRRCTGLQCRFLIQVSIALVMELLATWISTYTRYTLNYTHTTSTGCKLCAAQLECNHPSRSTGWSVLTGDLSILCVMKTDQSSQIHLREALSGSLPLQTDSRE